MSPTLLIMAAGIGSRYGGIKQLDGFGPSGAKIIDYTIYDAVQSGFGKIVFVIRHDIESDFRVAVSDRWKARIPMEFAYQELNAIPPGFTVPAGRQKPWGTGQAILSAASLIHEPFSVVNADDFYGRSSLKTIQSYLAGMRDSQDGGYCLIGYLLKNTLSEYGSVARGLCRQDSRGYLESLHETLGIYKEGDRIIHPGSDGRLLLLDGDALVSMNIWGFTPSFFMHLETDFTGFLENQGQDLKAEFYLTTVVDRVIRSGLEKVRVLSTDQQWFGVTFREDRPMVERSIRKLVSDGMYPENLWA
jgi:UTP-glucose-1-phosphate uridylyltransferase